MEKALLTLDLERPLPVLLGWEADSLHVSGTFELP
jgi:hypothetical protein